MEKYLKFLVFVFLFKGFTAHSQQDAFLFRPERGMEYFYEFTDSYYVLTEENSRFNPFHKRKRIKIQYDRAHPGEPLFLWVTVEENIAEKPDEQPFQIKNYQYPDLRDGYFDQRYSDFYENLLFYAEFQFEFDSATSQIQLSNRDEILEKIREVLQFKGFNSKSVEHQTERFGENGIPLIFESVQSIFRIPGIEDSPGNEAAVEFETITEEQEPLTTIRQKRRNMQTGLFSREIEMNQEEGLLLHFKTVEIDSTRYPVRTPENKRYHLIHHEKDFSLKLRKPVEPGRLKISGTIENPEFKKVTLSLLTKLHGLTFHQEVVFLDEKNAFQIETDLEHPQLVYVHFGLETTQPPPMLVFYAEPGSEIHFNATGNSFPWNVAFQGDFNNAAQLMNDFRRQHPVFDENIRLGELYWSFYGMDYSDFESMLKDFEPTFESNKHKIDPRAYAFIKKEIKAQLMCGIVDYLHLILRRDTRTYGYYLREVEGIDEDLLNGWLDSYNINLVYNHFGIHSRKFVRDYLSFSFDRKRETSSLFIPEYSPTVVISDYRYHSDLVLQIEFGRVILSGPALYGQAADILLRAKMRTSTGDSQTERFVQRKADEYLDLMLRVCNDSEFNAEIEQVIQTHVKWKSEDYVPGIPFLNPAGEEVFMKDFLGKKPVIFYVSRDWSVERYFFDDLAEENPEINYVMIMEGSNFKEWTDYLEAAEPKAHQLFLLNDEVSLEDIFTLYPRNFIIYDENGTRLGYGEDPLNSTHLVKHYLSQPEENRFDKSLLVTIIILMGIALFIIIFFLFFMKWRVRQRFRKQEQQRRLRELELTAIRSQMNPHFLFNSLNSVQNLVQQNKGREAHLYLSDFAGLIRKVLQNSEKEEVSLAEELEMTQQYLNLEKLRFDFDFSVAVDEEIDANNTMVPSLLLQPFAENAVIHGLQHKTGEKWLKIGVKKCGASGPDNSEKDRICIVIEDNGIGRAAAKTISTQKNGKGSRLMKERLDILEQKQGERYDLNITDREGDETGTRVEIILPDEK